MAASSTTISCAVAMTARALRASFGCWLAARVPDRLAARSCVPCRRS